MFKKINFNVIELEKNSYHLVVQGQIDDEKVLLIIDTGASRTIIDSSYSSKLEKFTTTNEIPIATGLMAETIPVEMLTIKSLSLGKVGFENVNVLSADLSAINEVYIKLTGNRIGGLIGSDFLLEYVKNIDIKKKCLVLLEKETL